MSNETLKKIKNNINNEFASLFREADFKQYSFIPVNRQSGFFFVTITEKANKKDLSAFFAEKNIKEPLKFITVDSGSFQQLLDSFIAENYPAGAEQPKDKPAAEEQKPPEQHHHKKRVGEILIEQGLLTEAQLTEALMESKRQHTPIGSMLVKKGFITVEQLKEALSSQLGYAYVSSEQLNISANVLKILPEDFIRENQLLALSSDGKFLDVGMVNPDNKKALNEIVYLTGLRPRVLLITYFEFQNCLAQYYSESRKETTKIIKKIEEEKLQFEVEESLWEQVDKEIGRAHV